jgi:hypothetical protein
VAGGAVIGGLFFFEPDELIRDTQSCRRAGTFDLWPFTYAAGGGNTLSKDVSRDDGRDDYCVVDDVRIGRVTRRENDPLKGCWDWLLHVTGHRDGLNIHGAASTLDEAKAAIKTEYEKWLALNRQTRV